MPRIRDKPKDLLHPDREEGSILLHPNHEEGSILPLILGFVGLVLALIVTVMAITSLYIERKRLFTLADATALVAAESFHIDDVIVSDKKVQPILRPENVHTRAEQFVKASITPLHEVRIVNATTTDSISAVVTLASMWHPPVLDFIFPHGFELEATVVSESVFSVPTP